VDLGTLQTVVTTWVEAASGVQLEWGRMPQKIHTEAFVLAYIGAITKSGHDERLQNFTFATDLTDVTVSGVRTMTLTLSFRSFDQRLGGSARSYAETFRTLIHSDTNIQTLVTAEIALVDTGELIDTDYEWSGRMVSQTDMDVTLAFRAAETDTVHDGSYIKYVNIDTEEYVVDEDDVVVVDVSGDFVTVDTD
jgi:hypothetical protein